jgi:molecular chaperone GrpE
VTSGISRDEILRRFESWLDLALTVEPPPGGIDADLLSVIASSDNKDNGAMEPGHDSYALWAATIALTQEVKLQGRAFKELNDTLATQPERIAEEVRASYRDRERDVQRETEHRCRKEALNALIDLRDRMERGLESVRKGELEIAKGARAGWLASAFSGKFREQTSSTIAAFKKGYELALERLDQTLDDFNVREIRGVGEPFDPRRMNAIDREETAEVPEGRVMEVYRSGYEWNGEVFRAAQVKVSAPKVQRP